MKNFFITFRNKKSKQEVNTFEDFLRETCPTLSFKERKDMIRLIKSSKSVDDLPLMVKLLWQQYDKHLDYQRNIRLKKIEENLKFKYGLRVTLLGGVVGLFVAFAIRYLAKDPDIQKMLEWIFN